MDQVIYVKAKKEHLRRALSLIPQILSGKEEDPTGLAEGVLLRIGMVALSKIREAFLIKSRGGIDEAGEKWEPLAPSTIARRRLGPNDRKRLQIGNRLKNLTEAQRKAYNRDIRRRKADLISRGIPEKQAAALARAQSFNALRGQGAKIPSRWELLSQRAVEILRDTGILFNSLSPGMPFHVEDYQPGDLTVGTSVHYAEFHHQGTSRMPQRRLWPDPKNWPQSWWDEINEQAVQGTIELIIEVARRA